MQLEKVGDQIYRIFGSVAGGVLVSGTHALLIDAPEAPQGDSLLQSLSQIGVQTVDMVLLTEHRRAACGGLLGWCGALPQIRATREEAAILQTADRLWRSNRGKYHRYHCVPDRFAPLHNLPVDCVVTEAEAISWREFSIIPVVFGARTDGDCAYVVCTPAGAIAFCGGLAMAGGLLHDVYSLQKALPDMMGYHGFLGGLPRWMAGVEALLALAPTLLCPAHGQTENNPQACLTLLRQRLLDYAAAYADCSAVRHYFPAEFHGGFEHPLGLTPANPAAPQTAHPSWLSRIGQTTSYLLRAASGHAILIDTGDREAIEAVLSMLARGELTALDACWITHYHDDHLNALHLLTHELDCEIWTTAAVAEVISNPQAWFLPALADCNVIARVLPDGARFAWEDFTLTALHHPGQTLYHSGLLVEQADECVLLCGDSFAPTGFDDYCADNRNLPGVGRGYRLCLSQLAYYGVTKLVNQHQSEPFCYDADYLALLARGMDRRDACLSALLPDDLGLGLDSQWLRVWPMEQTVTAGALLRLSVQVTAHGAHEISCRPRLAWDAGAQSTQSHTTDGLSSGSVHVSSPLPPDAQLHFDVPLPVCLRGDFEIPFDCWLDGIFLGSFITATVHIAP